ncbi:MAG: type I-E CRISPR-associated protein Cse1/CasA [Anaerolineae bacterium]|nr:type I-E CRISPR-associated protein Cse1/CasA [Anaerolineae bacterium]
MPESQVPHFNLWTDPWITLERLDGGAERLGLAETLRRAHEFATLYDPSPLVVAGIHRLLTAIAQAICNPQRVSNLEALWRVGQFPADQIAAFGAQYADRFDLFSETVPFFQSSDLPLHPTKADKVKSVSVLTAETSRITALQHYRHGRIMDEQFCPECAAKGLLTISPFISIGGSGFRPSINGIPPLYVFPGGPTFFHSLTASLLLPRFQPAARSKEDVPWWIHNPVVRTGEVETVGYLHSLTFPARRVRLHPQLLDGACTRCDAPLTWGIRTIIFEMGESRRKDAPMWIDPFVAYRVGKERPVAVRLQPDKALWREFAALFLMPLPESKAPMLRPQVLEQIAAMNLADDLHIYPVRCIGARTDQAKVLEWVDIGFDIPPSVLREADIAYHISQALKFSEDCEYEIGRVFQKYFRGKSTKSERHKRLKMQMRESYWSALAEPFRLYVLALGAIEIPAARAPETGRWADTVVATALQAFQQAADSVGDDAASLRQRVQGEDRCRFVLNVKRKKFQIGSNSGKE